MNIILNFLLKAQVFSPSQMKTERTFLFTILPQVVRTDYLNNKKLESGSGAKSKSDNN